MATKKKKNPRLMHSEIRDMHKTMMWIFKTAVIPIYASLPEKEKKNENYYPLTYALEAL